MYDEKGQTITKITPKSFVKVKKFIHGSREVDITGGMLQKVQESLDLARQSKITTVILNGNKKDLLYTAILGRKVIATIIQND